MKKVTLRLNLKEDLGEEGLLQLIKEIGFDQPTIIKSVEVVK